MVDIKVLIETYWNVNLGLPVADAQRAFGLNRNILECKFINGSIVAC